MVQADPETVRSTAADGFTALHLAAFFGQLEATAVLLEHGAAPDVVAANSSRVRPLHSAAAGGHAAIVGLLLERGADPDARQQGGYVPLHASAALGDVVSVRLLLDHGADRALRTDDGRLAADLASGDGLAELLTLAVEREPALQRGRGTAAPVDLATAAGLRTGCRWSSR